MTPRLLVLREPLRDDPSDFWVRRAERRDG
jgi:hypothetical protein